MGKKGESVENLRHKGEQVLKQLKDHKSRVLFRADASWQEPRQALDIRDLYLCRVKALTFEEKAPRREALENIFGMFRDIDGVNFIYLLLGGPEGIRFYFGIARDHTSEVQPKSIYSLGSNILLPGIQGNFRGCSLEETSNREKKQILEKLQAPHAASGMLTGVPGTDKDNEDFQGVDRLIDVMGADNFGLLVIARPYSEKETQGLSERLLDLFDLLTPLARCSFSRVKTQGRYESKNSSKAMNRQSGKNVQKTEGGSKSTSNATTQAQQDQYGNQQSKNDSQASTEQYVDNRSASMSDGDSTSNGSSSKSYGTHHDKNSSNAINSSLGIQNQSAYVFSHTVTQVMSATTQETEASSTNTSNAKNVSESYARTHTTGSAEEESTSSTWQEQLPVEQKTAVQWLKYIEEVLLPRLDYGRGKGLFLSCAYLFTDNKPDALRRLANTAISLYSGTKGNDAPLRFHSFLKADEQACEQTLRNIQLPLLQESSLLPECATAFSEEKAGDILYGASWLSANELGILAGLPQKEVPGLALREEVDFGLNVQETIAEENRIPLGCLVQNGVERTNLHVYLDRKALDKHMFVTGVTGSGKTTTCQSLLLESGLPFLVIEPAKTEYRALAKEKGCEDIIYFTPGRQDIAPFFLNPFELSPGETITSRADMFKATMEAAFEMEAAIPQILETSVYKAYENKGWDIRTNTWRPKEEEAAVDAQIFNGDPYAPGVQAFPTLTDYCNAVEQVTNAEGFDDRLRQEYLGSLKARLESLLVGSKGMMLDTPRSLDFRDLVHHKVVIELEEIKSGSEKSLLMGFILTNLLQAVRACHHEDPTFQHITLVEEAHRLLSRYVPGDSMTKKQGVEVFADMLAEVRKYGESLIIADQIPDKMTPEVLKNTNTKIVHKLFARDDKDAIGDTMALNDDQKSFLSKLPAGRAIVFSQGWDKALQVKIRPQTNTTAQQEINEEEIHRHSLHYYARPEVITRGVMAGVSELERPEDHIESYLAVMRSGMRCLEAYKELLDDNKAEARAYDKLKKLRREAFALEQGPDKIPREVWLTWLFGHAYAFGDTYRKEKFIALMQQVMAASTDEDFKNVTYNLKLEKVGNQRIRK